MRSESTEQVRLKVLDTADIVREVMLQRLCALSAIKFMIAIQLRGDFQRSER
jgi:hypothetical protein